jgi:hypothetical protein
MDFSFSFHPPQRNDTKSPGVALHCKVEQQRIRSCKHRSHRTHQADMRLFRPLFVEMASDAPNRFKPIKRLPFGRDSLVQRFDYQAPPPPPPHDFYPRQPKHWQLRGTPLTTKQNYLTACFMVYCVSAICIGLYFIEGTVHRWWHRFTGSEFPTTDQLISRRITEATRLQYGTRDVYDPSFQAHGPAEVRKLWKYKSGFGDYNPNYMMNPGDPAMDDL